MLLAKINTIRLRFWRHRWTGARTCSNLFLLLFVAGRAAAASYQPDLMVKLASEGDASYVGAGVFETSALTQTKSQASFPGAPALFRVLLRNAGDAPDVFLVTGTGSGDGMMVSYLDQGGVDRVAALSGTGYATGTLAPGESLSFTVQVAPVALTLGASYRVIVSAVSLTDATRIDQVKTETVSCGSSAAVTVSSPPDGLGAPGGVVNYPYTVTNVGNTDNSFSLTLSGSTGWTGAIYADDGAGGGVAADGVRQAGETRQVSSTGPLSPGAAYRFFVAVTIPQASSDGARGDARLGVAGLGANGGDQVTTSAVASSISVADSVRNLTQGGPFAVSANALPGDTFEYRMTITNSGSAAATAVGIDNAVPVKTALLPGTLWIGTSPGGDGSPCAVAQCGWARESAGNIVARLGQGTTESAGGTLLPGKTLYIYFRVKVE
jgi:uncharacterized repeat protein (TIGR01451 family)